MERQDYFLLVYVERITSTDCRGPLDGWDVLPCLQDLTADEAKAVQKAVELEDKEAFSTNATSRLESESEARETPGRYLVLSRRARRVEAKLDGMPKEDIERDGFYRLAVAALENADEARRLREASILPIASCNGLPSQHLNDVLEMVSCWEKGDYAIKSRSFNWPIGFLDCLSKLALLADSWNIDARPLVELKLALEEMCDSPPCDPIEYRDPEAWDWPPRGMLDSASVIVGLIDVRAKSRASQKTNELPAASSVSGNRVENITPVQSEGHVGDPSGMLPLN